MKRCNICKIDKSEIEFHKNKTRKDGLHYECKSCISILNKKKNALGRKSQAGYNKKYTKSRTEYVINYKLENPCIICGESNYVCLDFHHLDPSKKLFSIGKRANSMEKLKDEIAKCVILCSNCHKKLHAGFLILPE